MISTKRRIVTGIDRHPVLKIVMMAIALAFSIVVATDVLRAQPKESATGTAVNQQYTTQQDRLLFAPFDLSAELTPAGPMQFYTRQTLYEKINGQADLYLKAGMVSMATRLYAFDPVASGELEVFLYRMDRHRSAFAVFSMQPRPEALPLSLTPFACQFQSSLFFVHGQYYVEMIGINTLAGMADTMAKLAEVFVKETPAAWEPIPELEIFPTSDQVENSGALTTAGAFGFDGFGGQELFSARYKVQTAPLTAFFTRCRSQQDAVALADAYQAFLLQYDGKVISAPESLPDARVIRIMGNVELVFTQGVYLAGVRDASRPEDAESLAVRLNRHLSEQAKGQP